MPRRILVLFAHPVYERSRTNRALVEGAATLPGVTVHDLYETYPAMHLDVRREQALLLEHDVVVFQHPFYWYSAPPIIKQWQDLVLEYGWAYGKGGNQLRGKLTLNAISTGGPAHAYEPGGYNRFSMRQFLSPFDQTAHLCGMRFLAPFVVHASLRSETEADLAALSAEYNKLLTGLRDDTLDVERLVRAEKVERNVDEFVVGAAGRVPSGSAA